MGRTRKQKHLGKKTRKGGAIREILTEMRELLKNPNSKYMWKSNAQYEKLKDDFSTFNMNALDPSEFNEKTYADLLHEMKNLQWSHLTDVQKKELRALIRYEQHPERTVVTNRKGRPMNNINVENRIRSILEQQEPLTEEIIVWRGHAGGPKKILPISWFSTSTSEEIATKFKVGEKCCMFKIHLQPGVKVLDLYAVYKKYGIQSPAKESKRLRSLFQTRNVGLYFNYDTDGEIIVEEGGKFYKDREQKEEGFLSLNNENTVFETYYFPKSADYVPREGEWNEWAFWPLRNND